MGAIDSAQRFSESTQPAGTVSKDALVRGVYIGGLYTGGAFPKNIFPISTPPHLRHDLTRFLVNMVDFQNPAVVAGDFRAYTHSHISSTQTVNLTPFEVALMKLWHFMNGIYM
jgi:hypothetical protein